MITSNFPDRRKAIFIDIDRASGPAWTQVLTYGLQHIVSINQRISLFLNPPPPASAATSQQSPAAESLPRILTPLQQGNIFSKPPTPSNSLEKIESHIGELAKSYGQSPSPGTLKMPSLSPRTKSVLTSSSQKVLSSPSAQKLLAAAPTENLSVSGFRGVLHNYLMRFLRTPFGQPFRQTFARRVSSITLGTPHDNLFPILCSIKALAALAVASLEEDPFGRVSKDVSTLIRTYTETIETIEAFVSNLPPHWTDVEFNDGSRKVDDVAAVVTCLKNGLGDMLKAFGKYAAELGLRPDEMSIAKKAAHIEEASNFELIKKDNGRTAAVDGTVATR